MRSRKNLKNIPFFPLVPVVPAALLIGALVTSIRALVRVRRLEHRVAAATPVG